MSSAKFPNQLPCSRFLFHRLRDGQTALIYAAKNGNYNVARVLAEHGADPRIRVRILPLLVTHGPRLHCECNQDWSGRTAIDWAKKRNFMEISALLSQAQAKSLQYTGNRGRAHQLVPCGHGCGKILSPSERPHHEARCGKRVIACRLGCDVQNLWAEEQTEHEQRDCPMRRMHCEFGCNFVVKRHAMQEHLDKECPLRMVECPWCTAQMMAKDLPKHEQHGCNEATITCPKGCGAAMQGCYRHKHMREECPERQVFCRLGCDKEMRAAERESHEAWECPYRREACKWGCGQR